MERNIQKNGLVNLLVLLTVGLAGFAVARYSNSLAGQVGVVYLGLGILVAAVSWFQMRLEESERLEKLELEELAKGHSQSAMFDAKDAEVFPAQRSREQFEKFFVPIFTVLLGLAQAGGAYFFWRWLSRPATVPDLKEPLPGMIFFAGFALVLFILGRFSATFARLEHQRLLRPGASYLLLDAFLCATVAVGIAFVWGGYRQTDYYIAYVFCGLLALLSVETLIALLLEIYRPRVKGKVERPLYESRLVGLLGQPEGLITTAAQTVDYQFGFKVSETWFYRFFIRAVLWLVPLQLLVLVLSTSVIIIEPGQQGLLERWGKPVAGRTVLEPGLHLVWPRPMDHVYYFRTEQIQSFDVGVAPEEGTEKETVVLWTSPHGKEDNFLVANRDQGLLTATNQATGKRIPPVRLLTGSIPVQFQITNLVYWAYTNEDAPGLLQDLATREVVRYLAGADLSVIMSSGRQEAAEALARRLQAASDRYYLGARIISVGLQDLHPPVKVAPDYEAVLSALHKKRAAILSAKADAIRTNAMAEAQATTLVNRASAERVEREMGAVAQAGLFTNQIPAFEAAPSVYAERAALQTFVRATANARKYVMLTTNTHDVLMFDLQESVARDMLNVNIAAPKSK
jgi:regulator of protease activity HflC (stomatin/prohibitin superfamily)